MTELTDATEAALESEQERAPAPGAHRFDSIRRNTFFGLATQITTAAFTAVLTLYLVRKLGPHDYGLFALAVGIGTILVLISDIGISGAAGRFMAEESADLGRVARVVKDATRLKLLVLVPVCSALWLLAGPIADVYDAPGLVWPLRGMSIAVVGQGMFIFLRHSFVSIGRASLTWRMVLLESACEAGASIALVVLGAGAAGAAFGRGIGYVIGSLFGIAMVVKTFGRRAIGLSPQGETRRIARYGSAILIVTVAYTLFEQIGVLLIGAYIGTAAVGFFEAPNRLAVFLTYGGQAMVYGVGPRLARRGDEPPNTRMFTLATRSLVLLHGALLAPILVWAEPIADLVLGSGYSESIGVLRALAPFMFLAGIGTFITLAVNYVGEAKRRIWLAIATLAICTALDVVLLPTIGVVGGAIAMDVAFAGYVLGHFWICKRVFDFSVRRLVLTLVRCLLAAAAMSGVLALIGISSLEWWQWMLGAVLGPLAYVGVLVGSRELSRSELRAVRDQIPWGSRRADPS